MSKFISGLFSENSAVLNNSDPPDSVLSKKEEGSISLYWRNSPIWLREQKVTVNMTKPSPVLTVPKRFQDLENNVNQP